jgi:hypothetical protein
MRRFTTVGASFLVASCSSMPAFDAPTDDIGSPTVATVVDQVQCEIAEARNAAINDIKLKGIQPFDKWTAAVILTLTVNDTLGTATAGLPLSYIEPLKAATTSFAFNANPILYQSRARTYAQNYTIDISKIPDGQTCQNMRIPSHAFNLEGNLGLKDQIYMGLHSFSRSQQGADSYQVPTAAGKAGDNFGATVSFHIYKGITNVGPTWTFVTFKGPTAGVGYQRDDLHQIVITFAPAASKTAALPVPILPIFIPVIPSKPAGLAEGQVSPEVATNYANAVTAYNLAIATNQAAVNNRNAIIAANAAAPRNDAADTARTANQNLLTYQAIQNLGQALSRP